MIWRVLALLALLAVVAGLRTCRRALDREEEEAVRIWLLCDDCGAPARARVAALGTRAVPVLAVALESGPSASGRANVEAQLRDLYQQAGPMPIPEAEYVASYLANYVATYQTRAALSLGDIGTPRARVALRVALAADSAGTAPLPAGARQAAQRALAGQDPPFSGSLSDSSVAAFDTVTVRPGSQPWDGDEAVVLQGAPFPVDLMVFRSADSLRFLAVAPAGQYVVTMTGEPGGPVQVPLSVRTFRYLPLAEPLATNLAAPLPPPVLLLALGRPPAGDTVAYYRFGPVPGDRGFSVEADWGGSGNVDLAWYECGTTDPEGNTDGATLGKPERTSVVVPGGSCWTLAVILRAPATPAEIVRLRLTSP